MAKRLWLVRAGKLGEREQDSLSKSVLAPGFLEVADLSTTKSKGDILKLVQEAVPSAKAKAQMNFAAQLNQFVHTMQVGDLVVLPRKLAPLVAVGEVAGDYFFDRSLGHTRPVKWLATDVPRTAFKKDLLFSFGAFMTICEVQRNNALQRVEAVCASGVDPGSALMKPSKISATQANHSAQDAVTTDEEAEADLEELASQQVISLIKTEFAGHDLAELIAAILQVDGYTVRVSPPGPDGGRDILAADGPLGFGDTRICVQVKSGAGAADNTVVLSLQGAMANSSASLGLLVCLSGVTQPAQKLLDNNFFKLRLWQMRDLLDALYRTYDRLPGDMRAKIPLKQIWVPVQPAED